MAESQDMFSSEEDDDLILELTNKPPRFTQAPTQIESDILNDNKNELPDILPTQGRPQDLVTQSNPLKKLEAQLNEAQGEASMLRDKIKLINNEREKERLQQLKQEDNIRDNNLIEINKLKQTIQQLNDEKKFLIMESKTLKTKKSNYNNSTSTNNAASFPAINQNPDINSSSSMIDLKTIKSSPLSKKRRIESNSLSSSVFKNNFIQLNNNRIITDESSIFFDSIISHKLVGTSITTMGILNLIKLGNLETFSFKNFKISKDESIGKCLTKLMLQCKQSMPLDKFIDTLLENIATLIKEILFNDGESNLAIPFLVVVMYQCVAFRPSAVHSLALKDLFMFTCDLIKANQHVLKQSLYESPLELHVEPQIFQYELIDNLIICYSFDLLETILNVLQIHSTKSYKEFLDANVLKSLEHISKISLTISYKPILNVVFNMVEIFNILTSILMSIPNHDLLIEAVWWKDCISRMYVLLDKDITNCLKSDAIDLTSFNKKRLLDVFGLIRTVGDNTWASSIPNLVYKDTLQSLPRIIAKDDIFNDSANHDSFKVDFNFENWLLKLKDDILTILENLMLVYREDPLIGNGEMLIHMTKLLAREQEEVLEKNIGQDNPNIIDRTKLIEHIITIIYQLFMNHNSNMSDQNIKGIETELVTSLWRVVVSQTDSNIRNTEDMKDHRHLIDKLNELILRDAKIYYEDAFEDIPEYIETELNTDLEQRSNSIMQIQYAQIYQDMAKTILESKLGNFLGIDETDSLYLAMGI